MKITIPVDSLNYYYYTFKILAPFKPYSVLTEKERRLLALIFDSYGSKTAKRREDLDSLVFSTPNKKRMQEQMKISKAGFDNCIAALRKKGFTTYHGLEDKYRGLLKREEEIIFKFKFK